MFNVKSRKLVLTLFCSLALVLVLTDGASANSHLDGHRMLRKRSPQLVELVGRQTTDDIIDVGTKGEGEDPNDPANSVSSVSSPPVSINFSSSGTMSNDANPLCPLGASFDLSAPYTYWYLALDLHPSESHSQPERVVFEPTHLLATPLSNSRTFFLSASTERYPFIVSDKHFSSRSGDAIHDCHFLRLELYWYCPSVHRCIFYDENHLDHHHRPGRFDWRHRDCLDSHPKVEIQAVGQVRRPYATNRLAAQLSGRGSSRSSSCHVYPLSQVILFWWPRV